MTVSIQYIVRPVETFVEVARVLRPRAPFIVTFSNRMFPTKAIMLWQHAGESERATVVETYFARSEAFDGVTVIDQSDAEGQASDPIWAVTGYRKTT